MKTLLMSMNENQNACLLTIDETSDFLNLKKSKIRSMVFKNQIPVIRLGRCLRFNRNDLVQWLSQKKSYSL